MGTPKLPVYLIHWNAPEWLGRSIASLHASDIPVSVTVIDNSGTLARTSLPDDVTLVCPGANLGYAGGANVGLRSWMNGSSPWCVVGAHDLIVEPSDLRLLIEAGERSPVFGILGPGTEEYYAGERLGTEDGIEERTAMSGTCLLLRRACIEEIGVFDERFGSYCEDDDLCFRARRLGWKVGRVPETAARGIGTAVGKGRMPMQMGNWVLVVLNDRGRWAALKVVVGQVVVAVRTTIASPAEATATWRGVRRGLGHFARGPS